MDICWETCAVVLYAVLNFCIPFPYGVWGRKWNLIVSVPDHCLFIYFAIQKAKQLIKWLFGCWMVTGVSIIICQHVTYILIICNTTGFLGLFPECLVHTWSSFWVVSSPSTSKSESL